MLKHYFLLIFSRKWGAGGKIGEMFCAWWRFVFASPFRVVAARQLVVARKQLFGVYSGIHNFVYGNTQLCLRVHTTLYSRKHTKVVLPCNA